MTELAVPLRHTGAPGAPVLLLLHGLASSGATWSRFAAALPAEFSWLAVDLPGHGRSAHNGPYSFGQFAQATAQAVRPLPDGPLTVVGHSLGGAVALLLGSGLFGLPVSRVVLIGTKLTWSPAELDSARAVAAKAPKVFATRADAESFWRKVAGIDQEAVVDSADVVTEDGGGWRLSYDQAAAALGAAPVRALLPLVAGEVVIARGEHDPLLSAADAAALDAHTVTVAGTGHSPHVEDPRQLAGQLGHAAHPVS